MTKTRKGGGSGNKKALNDGWQARQANSEQNIAEMQSKGPCNKACKCKPLRMADVNGGLQHWLKYNLA